MRIDEKERKLQVRIKGRGPRTEPWGTWTTRSVGGESETTKEADDEEPLKCRRSQEKGEAKQRKRKEKGSTMRKVLRDLRECCKAGWRLRISHGISSRKSISDLPSSGLSGLGWGQAWLGTVPARKEEKLEPTDDLRRGALWKTVPQLEGMRWICDKAK